MPVSAGPDGDGRAAPSGPPMRAVIAFAAAFAVFAIALVPLAQRPGPPIPGFVSLFVAGFAVTELSTAFLLFVRFRERRTWSLLMLCCAYFYSGLMPIPHLLTFPGAVLAERPIVAGSQATAWIFNAWISGFALLALISIILEAWFADRRISHGKVRLGGAAALGAVLIVTAAMVVGLMTSADRLPHLVSGPTWTALDWVAGWLAVLLLGAGIAIVLFVIGERSRLYLWLGLALTAMMFANTLSTVGGGRFTVGWSAGRLSWLLSSCVLFVYLMVLHARDHRLLVRAGDLLVNSEASWTPDRDRGPRPASPTLEAAMQRFVARENIARYRKMLEMPHDEAHRQVISRMLAEQENLLETLDKSA
ncbi:MAG TPA: MASE4 domain-containing protein [Xanthobacteraceae bacterium]|nr:MASE4 domain-containing protein [Xanthobacteraceae bacterium]